MVEEKDENNQDSGIVVCIFCGMRLDQSKAWALIDGDANLGVKKIEYFCSQEHKFEYFRS